MFCLCDCIVWRDHCPTPLPPAAIPDPPACLSVVAAPTPSPQTPPELTNTLTHTHTHPPCPCPPPGVPGITLHTSEDGGSHFKAACLPVALRVSGGWAHAQPAGLLPATRSCQEGSDRTCGLLSPTQDTQIACCSHIQPFFWLVCQRPAGAAPAPAPKKNPSQNPCTLNPCPSPRLPAAPCSKRAMSCWSLMMARVHLSLLTTWSKHPWATCR